jgi:hypothetical protein
MWVNDQFGSSSTVVTRCQLRPVCLHIGKIGQSARSAALPRDSFLEGQKLTITAHHSAFGFRGKLVLRSIMERGDLSKGSAGAHGGRIPKLSPADN